MVVPCCRVFARMWLLALCGLAAAQHCPVPVAVDAPYFQTVVERSEVDHLVSLPQATWRLPNAQELACHLTCMARPGAPDPSPPGLYWIQAPDARSRQFAWYFHAPSCKVLEYGDLVFPARLVLVQQHETAPAADSMLLFRSLPHEP